MNPTQCDECGGAIPCDCGPGWMINQLRHAKEAVEALKSVCTPEQIKHADHLISRAFVLHCQREFEANPGRFREHGPTGGVPEFLDPKFLDSEDGQAQ